MKYEALATVTISICATVEADSLKEATGKVEDLGMRTFCFGCSEESDEDWTTTGELDGTPFDVFIMKSEVSND